MFQFLCNTPKEYGKVLIYVEVYFL
jgi:hypothetical protein